MQEAFTVITVTEQNPGNWLWVLSAECILGWVTWQLLAFFSPRLQFSSCHYHPQWQNTKYSGRNFSFRAKYIVVKVVSHQFCVKLCSLYYSDKSLQVHCEHILCVQGKTNMQDRQDHYTNKVTLQKVMKCTMNITEIENITHAVHTVLWPFPSTCGCVEFECRDFQVQRQS